VVHLAVQVALRNALSGVSVDGALATAHRTLSPSLTVAARAAAGKLGIDVREVVVKDVLLPDELRAVQLLPNGSTLELIDAPD
jgi:regulator of protease activity HflC (stomatin/prohibitin superfamily)